MVCIWQEEVVHMGIICLKMLLRSETWHPIYHCGHLGFRNPDFPITFLGTLWTSSKKDLRPTPGLHWKYANWYQWHYRHNSHYEYVSMISGIMIIKETSSQTQKVKSTKDEPLVQSAKGLMHNFLYFFLLPSFSDIIAHRGLYHGIALLEECKIWSWYCRNALHCSYILFSVRFQTKSSLVWKKIFKILKKQIPSQIQFGLENILEHKKIQFGLEYSSPSAKRALRALGLLLADGVCTVRLGKTFWRKTGQTERKRA